MTAIRAATPHEFSWLTQRTGYHPGGDFVALVYPGADGAPLGMVGFDAWKPNSCQAHIAMDSRMVGIALARAAFPFVFEFGGRGLILGTVAASNAASIGLALRLGFTMTHAVQDGWAPGVDLVGLELRKENCRWLRSHTGKRKAA